MLEESGYKTAIYDPLYAPDSTALNHRYDIITCTEVVEHAREPMQLWQQLQHCLHRNGVLVVMTKRVKGPEAFRSWHYIQDLTHVVFYSATAMQWVAQTFGWTCTFECDDVAVFQS